MMANGRIRPLWPVLISIFLALLVSGCSNSNENSGFSLVDQNGDHPSNFLSTHPGYAVAEINQCTQCHGDDLMGGISNQSCFLSACHHDPEPNWVATPPAAQPHGASAKAVPGSSGFISCQICHAVDFSGGGAQVSCLSAGCHGGAGQSPHPANWRTGGTYVHTNTNEGNASVCAQCHLNGANSPIPPPTPPAPAGTAPGCFNNTLCHEAGVPHPVGGTWVTVPPAAQPHGNDAKAAPGATTGFNYCQVCHGTGTDFAGGSSGVSCYTCHGASAPHPASWRTGDTYVHTSVDGGNASVCAFCHTDGANSPIPPPSPPAPAGTPPGCFNNTLCHEAGVPHPVGGTWVTVPPAAQPHGNDAKAAPGATTGFNYCQVCHGTGTDFAGGSSGISCYTCHGASAPHPASWRTGDTYVHTSVDGGNASVCAFCHTDGANSPIPPPSPPAPAGTAPGCFNNTLCHEAGVPHPVGIPAWWAAPPAAQPHGNDAKAAPGATTGFNYCQVCHGTGTDFAGGSSGVSCYTCHGASAPHPASWRTGDTYVHTSVDGGNASVCAFCHTDGANSPIPPPSPPAPAGTPPGCFNSTLCHGVGVPAGTHVTGWLDLDNTAVFHGLFVTQTTCETAACHPISGHPTCTSCHFDNQGSRAYTLLGFTHDASVFTNHRDGALASAAGTICENCHQTSRTFRAGSPPTCQGGGQDHPNNDGCHYDATLLDPVLTNPRF